MHEVLVNRLGGLSLPRKSAVRLTDRPDMTLDVYRGRKATMQCLSCVKFGMLHCLYQVCSNEGLRIQNGPAIDSPGLEP